MQKLDGQLITVLGGGGFLGRYVVQRLLARGARVRIAQRTPRAATFLKPLGGLGQTQFVTADVRDAASIARAVQGSDAVINLVGAFGDMQAVQADGAGHAAAAAKAAGIATLVHVSAIGADRDSLSAYGRSKGDGEAAVRAAFADAVILRPSIIFGREDQFINRFAALIRMAPVVPVIAPKHEIPAGLCRRCRRCRRCRAGRCRRRGNLRTRRTADTDDGRAPALDRRCDGTQTLVHRCARPGRRDAGERLGLGARRADH